MSINVDIHKKLGAFSLDIAFHSDSKRIGILGASGCGKSMTLKCIAGIEKPDSGSIVLDDRTLFDSAKKINPKPQKRNVGYLFQNYALFPTMSVRDNIGVGIRSSRKEKTERVNYFISKFQLKGLEDRLPGELSGGQQQRVALARIMAYEPDVILLDEPFSALDVYLKDRLQHELLTMLDEYKGTVIMVSHSRDEIYRFSDELLIIDQGQTVCYGETGDIFDHPGYKEAARLTGCKNIVDVKRIDDYIIQIPAWNTELHFQSPIPQNIRSIGIRAHDFIPVWNEIKENGIHFGQAKLDTLPFEKKYYIKAYDPDVDDICWFVQRNLWEKLDKEGQPDCLVIPEDKILLLQ